MLPKSVIPQTDGHEIKKKRKDTLSAGVIMKNNISDLRRIILVSLGPVLDLPIKNTPV